MEKPPVDPLPSEILQSYTVIRTLGSGGMGCVYEARQIALNRLVALKVLKQLGSTVARSTERFRVEAEILSRLRHPNIVSLYDAGIAGEGVYLAMELVDGGTLHDRLRGGRRIELPAALALAAQVLDGLAYLHENGIVHRDLKPENLLIDSQGKVKLADFGLAAFTENPAQLTEAGRVVGTPIFMSPEQILRRQLGPPSDLYAVAVLLYRVLTGIFPFERVDERTLLMKKIEQEGCSEEVLKLLPESVRAPLQRCLLKRPEDRFASAGELKAALVGGAASASVSLDVSALEQALEASTLREPPAAWNVRARRPEPSLHTSALHTIEQLRIFVLRHTGRAAILAAAALVASSGALWYLVHGAARPYALEELATRSGVDLLSFQWRDRRAFPVRAVLDGRRLPEESARDESSPDGLHRLTVPGLQAGRKYRLGVEFPDGTLSPVHELQTAPLVFERLQVWRAPQRVVGHFRTAMPTHAVARLRQDDRPVDVKSDPDRFEHTLGIGGLDPGGDYTLELEVGSAAGTATTGPISLPNPLGPWVAFARRIGGLAPIAFATDLTHRRAAGEAQAALRKSVETALVRIDCRKSLLAGPLALESVIEEKAYDESTRCQIASRLEELRYLDETCEVLKLGIASGVAAALPPPLQASRAMRSPPAAKMIAVPISGATHFNRKELTIMRFMDRSKAIDEATYAFEIPGGLEQYTAAELMVQVAHLDKGAVLLVELSKDARALTLVYGPEGQTFPGTNMVGLYHAVPIQLLAPGEWKMRIRLKVLATTYTWADTLVFRGMLALR